MAGKNILVKPKKGLLWPVVSGSLFVVAHEKSHAYTILWECCKDDRQSQWENGKIWPSADAKPLNRSSPNLKHMITSQISTTIKIKGQSGQGFVAPIHPKYTPKTFEGLLHFFLSSSGSLQKRSLDWFSHLKIIGKGFYRNWVKSSFEQFITTQTRVGSTNG